MQTTDQLMSMCARMIDRYSFIHFFAFERLVNYVAIKSFEYKEIRCHTQ